MLGLKVQITRFVDDCQPGIVECQLVDAVGHLHSFIEKVPIISSEDLSWNNNYPRPGIIACEEIGRCHNELGKEIVKINTEQPWGVESTDGKSHFEVFQKSLVILDSK